MKKPFQANGLGVDSSGGPTVDPTRNVLDLVEREIKRIDDMAMLRAQLAMAEVRHATAIGELHTVYESKNSELHATFQRALDKAESDRLNAIRQVDREEVAKTAAAAQTALQTLAASTAALAETLRTQVATTASAAEARLGAFSSEITKRLSALELSSSEGKGKQAYADPQLADALAEMRSLARSRDTSEGKAGGINAFWVILLGAAALLSTLIALYTGLKTTTTAQPQVIYVPAPAGTLMPQPTAPSVPR